MTPIAGTGVCLLCGEPLGSEPHFISHYPDGEHVACAGKRFDVEEFPLQTELYALRALFRSMAEAYKELVGFGKWLATMAHGWPKTRETLAAEYRDRRRRLKEKLRVLGPLLR